MKSIRCDHIEYQKSVSLKGQLIRLREIKSKKVFSARVLDHCFDDQKGIIVTLNNRDVLGHGLRINYKTAEPASLTLNPSDSSLSGTHISLDLRNIFNDAAQFELLESETDSIKLRRLQGIDEVRPNQFLLILKKSVSFYGQIEMRGIDFVTKVDSTKYHYNPVSDLKKDFSCTFESLFKFEVFEVSGKDKTEIINWFNKTAVNTKIIHQYLDTWAEMFELSTDEVSSAVQEMLSKPSSFLAFMNTFNRYNKVLNDLYFDQIKEDSKKVKDMKLAFQPFFLTFN